MKVTYHHNFFDRTIQRHPRVRFGKAHVYQNYYLAAPFNTVYGVSSNLNAQAMVEGNYFVNVPVPTETSRDGSPPGTLLNVIIFLLIAELPGAGGTVFEPSNFIRIHLDPAC